MNAQELYRAGKLAGAIEAAGGQLRDDPANVRLRTFLFELLCFAGEYDRAEKQLGVLGQGGQDKELGALLYHGCLAAERARLERFEKGEMGMHAEPLAVAGTLNGTRFESLEDADPRISGRLELFAAGSYMWLPLEHVASIEVSPPKRLRDLVWAPAKVATGPGFRGMELGEVLLPALAVGSFKHPDEAVRLGRMTVWEQEEGRAVPYGQKMFLVDGEEFPLLEIRTLTIDQPAAEANASA
jgi:type VI secretion system protein ImpE